MDIHRKSFLRLAGLSMAAITGERIAGPLAGTVRAAERTSDATMPARRWALVIDAGKCLKKDGCDSCIKACNRSHNIPEIVDPRHEVKWIRKEPFKAAFISAQSEHANAQLRDKPFVVLCNHCDRPPCVRVCPTRATWKREDGIV